MSRIRIVLVEDNAAYARDLGGFIEQSPDFRCAGIFTHSVRFLAALPALDADVILLDINMPRISGLECLRQVREFLPCCRVIMLTFHDDDEMILDAFLGGADGYLLKESTPREIRAAIHETLDGGAPMTSRIARRVVRLLGRSENLKREPGLHTASSEGTGTRPVNPRLYDVLSRRELEILQLLAQGKRYAEIAAKLFISLPTVKTHINHIYDKLRARNKVEAISQLQG